VEIDDDDRIDFSPLDPTRDGMRFERFVRTVAARAAAGRRHAVMWAFTIRWWRPALILAAMLTLFAWAPWLMATARTDSGALAMADPAATLVQWVHNGKMPSAYEMLDSLRRVP